jgi:hypothetical protein
VCYETQSEAKNNYNDSGKHRVALGSDVPACGEPITAQAAVEEFKPDDWVSFWGRMGERWKKCEGAHGGRKFVHFYVQFNRGVSHRLAWIAPEPDAAPVQETLL